MTEKVMNISELCEKYDITEQRGAELLQEFNSDGVELDMFPIKVLIGSLIVSPIVSKAENIEMFNNWIKEKYND